MSRPTDTERGARIAFHAASRKLDQGDLFPNTAPVDRELWQSIRDRAWAVYAEEEHCRAELSRLRYLPRGAA